MADLRRMPPGRAGRLWLTDRLAAAQHAGSLLDRKLRILLAERERAAMRERGTREAWLDSSERAREWLARAAALGGDRALRRARTGRYANVELTWTTVMGLSYPAAAGYRPPDDDAAMPPDGTAALIEARAAARRAASDALDYAVARAAVRAIDAELATTRQRLRAITDRWTPRLEHAYAQLAQQLEEAERSELVQLRWATGRRPGSG